MPTGIVGISRDVLDRHRRADYFHQSRIQTVIGNPSDIEVTEARADGGSESPRYVRFGYLGRLHATKGIELLLDQVQHLPAGQWRLSIAGCGEPGYERALHRFERREIEFLGWVEPDTLFRRIDVLVVPSMWSEPFGRGVIEAYAHGVPVIGSTRGGIPELIEHGVTGLLFDPDHPGSLAGAIQSVLDDPGQLRAMAVRCTEKAQSFEPALIADQYMRVYEEVLGRRHQRRPGRAPDGPQ